ncbi:type VI secretion system baseplate subunit TssE [Pseudomonas sp. X10]
MADRDPSLYEMLLQNFDGDLELAQVAEDDQLLLSVLDNVRRLLNSRAGTLAHLPDYGLPDMSLILQTLPTSAHGLKTTLAATLLKYEPRLAKVEVQLLAQRQPGQLDYALDLHLKAGLRVRLGTSLAAGGEVLVHHLKQQP